MLRLTRWPLGAFAFVCALLPACAAPRGSTKIESFRSSDFATLLVERSQLVASRLRVTSSNEDRPNGYLRVQITGEALVDDDFRYEYRFQWYDEGNLLLPTPNAGWRTIHVDPLETIVMTGVAPDRRAAGWVFEVRFPERW